MKQGLLLIVFPLLVACGNTAQKTNNTNYAVIEDSVPDWVNEETTSNDYSEQKSDIGKEFNVKADIFKVNTTTMEMTFRGKESLHVTLYSNHSAYAIGDNGASMQVYESTQSGYDFMCSVYGSKYIYFFNTDEIQ